MDVDESDSNFGSVDEEALSRGIANVLQSTTKWVNISLSLISFYWKDLLSLPEKLFKEEILDSLVKVLYISIWSSIIPWDDYLCQSMDMVLEQTISVHGHKNMVS